MAVIKMMTLAVAMIASAHAVNHEAEKITPGVKSNEGNIYIVIEEGKEVGIKIGSADTLLFSEMEPRMKRYTDASINLASKVEVTGWNKGVVDALPIMAIGPAIKVKADFISSLPRKMTDVQYQADNALARTLTHSNFKLDGMSDTMAAFEAETAKSAETLKAAIADLTKKTADQVAVLNADVAKTVSTKTKTPIAALQSKVDANNAKFEMMRKNTENTFLLDGKDVSKMSLKTVTQGCTAYGPCAQTQQGYDKRRFFKVDFNPGSPGSWHDSLFQLSEGCQKLNDYLTPNCKPYGLDRKLMPVCNHANTHNTEQCITLPGTYFSHCYNKNRHCYGLDNTILYRTVTSDNMYWGGTSLLSHDGNNNHNWRHGRNNHWRYTLCTSEYFRGTGPDVAWQE